MLYKKWIILDDCRINLASTNGIAKQPINNSDREGDYIVTNKTTAVAKNADSSWIGRLGRHNLVALSIYLYIFCAFPCALYKLCVTQRWEKKDGYYVLMLRFSRSKNGSSHGDVKPQKPQSSRCTHNRWSRDTRILSFDDNVNFVCCFCLLFDIRRNWQFVSHQISRRQLYDSSSITD